MTEDQRLQQAVLDELGWEPSVDAAHIGVTAKDGVVTLSGHVESYAEKIAAEQAARRVRGVEAIAEEIEVRIPGAKRQADDDIAARALKLLDWDVMVPSDRIRIKVEKGRVTLTGQVEWNYQRQAAENDVRLLSGVVGVLNLIELTPRVRAAEVRDEIERALRRHAEMDASNLRVDARDGKVVLTGEVSAPFERDAAERAAWSAPGVREVENRISVAPLRP